MSNEKRLFMIRHESGSQLWSKSKKEKKIQCVLAVHDFMLISRRGRKRRRPRKKNGAYVQISTFLLRARRYGPWIRSRKESTWLTYKKVWHKDAIRGREYGKLRTRREEEATKKWTEVEVKRVHRKLMYEGGDSSKVEKNKMCEGYGTKKEIYMKAKEDKY